MLSQLSKTIKLALKSTESERAILRARSAVQRFPVIEWRQKMEDFHRRSIQASRRIAGSNAWRETDCGNVASRPLEDTDDWNPVQQSMPTQPDWDAQSAASASPRFPASPLSYAPGTPRDEQYLAAPPRFNLDPGSSHSDHSDEESFTRNSMATSAQPYDDFLERANRTIAKKQGHAPDPFLDAPQKPFGSHSRRASMESISTIVEEKTNSPLNKAIASVRDCHICLWLVALIEFYTLVHGFRRWRRSGVRTEAAVAQCRQLEGGTVDREVPDEIGGALLRSGPQGETL